MCDALDFLSDDHNLTDKGKAARESLLSELEEIERDLEAVRQEHRLGYQLTAPPSRVISSGPGCFVCAKIRSLRGGPFVVSR